MCVCVNEIESRLACSIVLLLATIAGKEVERVKKTHDQSVQRRKKRAFGLSVNTGNDFQSILLYLHFISIKFKPSLLAYHFAI
jgi:hypothetical protein